MTNNVKIGSSFDLLDRIKYTGISVHFALWLINEVNGLDYSAAIKKILKAHNGDSVSSADTLKMLNAYITMNDYLDSI